MNSKKCSIKSFFGWAIGRLERASYLRFGRHGGCIWV